MVNEWNRPFIMIRWYVHAYDMNFEVLQVNLGVSDILMNELDVVLTKLIFGKLNHTTSFGFSCLDHSLINLGEVIFCSGFGEYCDITVLNMLEL